MKYSSLFFAIFFMAAIMQIQAQQPCNLHIVTSPDNQMQGFPFQFEINGTPFKLKAGHCLELKLAADSLHIIVKDKRWVKNETVDLHIKAAEDVYVRILWGWKQGDKKKIRCIAEALCKSCFDEYKQKCKKEWTE
ncbi:MAG: hypothetical protein IPP43_09275 [Chitinophagaceae bacterium]|nr:hypothetical protein [Chitinophagaceae bacterium]MBL0131268.1 hypothetical protein [Chitinophagaceae bacterium]